jgi:hypothetical protein
MDEFLPAFLQTASTFLSFISSCLLVIFTALTGFLAYCLKNKYSRWRLVILPFICFFLVFFLVVQIFNKLFYLIPSGGAVIKFWGNYLGPFSVEVVLFACLFVSIVVFIVVTSLVYAKGTQDSNDDKNDA